MTLSRFRKPINKVSSKQKLLNAALKIIRDEVFREQQSICYLCDTKYLLEGAHIIRRTASLDLYADKNNIVGLCRRCHVVFDDGPLLEFLSLKNASALLQRMKRLDELYYNRYLDLTLNMKAQIIFTKQYRSIEPGTLFDAEIHQFSDKNGFQAFSVSGHDKHHFHIGRIDVSEIFDIIQFVNADEAEAFTVRYHEYLPEGLKTLYMVSTDDVAPEEIVSNQEDDLP